MPKITIPDDWNQQDRELWLLCAPASPRWRQALRTAVLALTRGRSWDGETGIITEAQAVGWEIFDSMTTCTDLTNALQSIAEAIEKIPTPPTPPAPIDTRSELLAIANAVSVCCSGDVIQTPDIYEYPGSPGEMTEPPDGYTTVDEYLCAAGHYIAENHARISRELYELFQSPVVPIVLFVTVIAGLIAFGASVVVAVASGTAFALFTKAMQILVEQGASFFLDAEAIIRDHAACYAQGWREGDGIDGKIERVLELLEGNDIDALVIDYIGTVLFGVRGYLDLVTYGQVGEGETPEYLPEVLEYVGRPCTCLTSIQECLDFTSCGLADFERPVEIVVTAGDPEHISYNVTFQNGDILFDVTFTGETTASTPEINILTIFADGNPTGTQYVLQVDQLEVYGDITKVPRVNGMGVYPVPDKVVKAGSTASSVRTCMAAEILAQTGVTVTVGSDFSKTIIPECNRPGAGNFVRIVGRATLCARLIRV